MERTVLDGNRNLIIRPCRWEWIICLRSWAGQHSPCAEAGVSHRLVARGAATDDVETGGSSIDVERGHTQSMVRVPDGGGPVIVGELKRRKSITPDSPIF